jgi:hypothetical protein
MQTTVRRSNFISNKNEQLCNRVLVLKNLLFFSRHEPPAHLGAWERRATLRKRFAGKICGETGSDKDFGSSETGDGQDFGSCETGDGQDFGSCETGRGPKLRYSEAGSAKNFCSLETG